MDWNETVIPVGKGDEGFDISPDGRELWTANAQDGTLSVIDLTMRTVTATLDAKTFGANRLKFTPDGKLVLISSLRDGDLVIYDASSRNSSECQLATERRVFWWIRVVVVPSSRVRLTTTSL
jgi:YVTN family beta-propeller protein